MQSLYSLVIGNSHWLTLSIDEYRMVNHQKTNDFKFWELKQGQRNWWLLRYNNDILFSFTMQTLQRYSQVLIFIYLNTYNTLYQPPQQFLVWYNYRFTDCEHLQHTVLQLDEMDFYYSKDKPIFKDLNLNTQSDSRICIVCHHSISICYMWM